MAFRYSKLKTITGFLAVLVACAVNSGCRLGNALGHGIADEQPYSVENPDWSRSVQRPHSEVPDAKADSKIRQVGLKSYADRPELAT